MHTKLKGRETDKERNELLAAKEWNEKTKALLGENLPGHPDARAGVDFKNAIRVNAGYVALELGRLAPDPVEKVKFLNEAKNEYLSLVVSRPNRAAPYCNRMAAYSLLAESAADDAQKSRFFEDALKVIDNVHPTANDEFRTYILDLENEMPELIPLREYVEKHYQKKWEATVKERLG